MKRLVLIVCGLLITALSAFAEVRLNSRGERMASQLYTLNCKGDTTSKLIFQYDQNDEIVGVKAYLIAVSSKRLLPYFTISYQKGRIKRVDYDCGKPIKNRAYEYEFNESGQLFAKSILEWGDGVTIKHTDTYEYADDCIMSGESHDYAAEKDGIFYTPDDSMFISIIFWMGDDGNVTPANLLCIRDNDVVGGLRIHDRSDPVPPEWDYNLVNNINIELAAMSLHFNMHGCGFSEQIEFITRWLPVRSRNLLKEYGNGSNRRKVIYSFDKDGYPIEVVDVRKYPNGQDFDTVYRIEYVN